MRRNLSNLLRVGSLLLLVLLVTSPRIALAPQTPMPGTADMGGMFAPGTTTAIPSHHFHPASGYCPPYYQPPYPPVYLPPGLYECWPCVCTEREREEEEPWDLRINGETGKNGDGENGEDIRRRKKEEWIKRVYERIPQWIWDPLPLREYIRKPTEETPEDQPDTRLGEGIGSPSERIGQYPPGLEPGEDTRKLPERTWPYPPVLEEPIRVDQTPPMLEGTVYPVSENGWINRNVEVTLHAGDEENGSGIAAIHYLWNGKQVTIVGEGLRLSPDRRTATHKIALQDDGIHELVCWTVDASGNESSRTSLTVRIDKIAPTISATSVPTTEGGWGNANAKVTLSAQDQAGGSGIASIEYTLDGGKAVIERAQLRQTYDTFTHKLAITQEGIHQLTFQTKDLAGNWSSSGSQTIRIDRTSPMIEATRSPAPTEHGWNNQDVIVRFHCSDDLSGIASCTNEQRVSSEGRAQAVMGEAVDRAGNSVKAYVIDISIDRTPPSVSVSPYSPSITSGETIALTIEASDSGSGIAYVMAEDSTSGRISLGREGDRWTGSLQPSQDGQITVRVTDGADNVTTRSVSYTVQAKFDVRNLSVTLEEPSHEGTKATIHCTIKNIGGRSAEQSIRLFVDGYQKNSQQLTLAPSKSQNLSFSYVFPHAGEYRVKVQSDDDADEATVDVRLVEVPCPSEADPFAPPETIVHLRPRTAVVLESLRRGDVGWNDLVYHSVQYMPEEIGEIVVQYAFSAADMLPIVTNLSEGEDFDLIVCVGWLCVDVLDYIARDFPQQRFAVIGAWWTEAPNVMAIDFRNDEGAALAGALAALAAAEYAYDRVGGIAGIEAPYYWAAEAGYRFGVHWANQWYEDAFGSDPNIHVSYAYTGGFGDEEHFYDEAIKQLEEGAGMLFGVCPREDAAGIQSALSEWAKAYEIASAPPYYLGFDAYADWLFAGRLSLGSVLVRVDAAYCAALRSIVEDTFAAGTTWMGLAEGGVALSTEEDLLRELVFAVDAGLADVSDYQETIDNWIRNRESIPDWVWQAVAELRCQIIAGVVALPVPETDEEMERIRAEYP